MLGLTMFEDYLQDLLTGRRTYDVRHYPTNKRGRIGLVKSKTNLLYGYVDFVKVRQISYEEFVYWHINEDFTVEDANESIRFNNTLKNKKIRHAYAYDFVNPVLLDSPVKINIINKNGSWVEFNDEENQKSYKKQTLF